MLVSIVVPNLNKRPFLGQALESIFQQDYPEIEVIAIDGGSNDGSLDVFERYRDRFAQFRSEPDDGQANAINKGFRLARGKVVAWLNSDDLYYPNAVSRAVAAFQQDANLDLLYGDAIFVDEANRYLRSFVEVEAYSEYRLRNCSDYIMQPTTFFRRAALKDVGYLDESLHFAFDWDLWCKLARRAGAVKYVAEFMAAARIYPETKTSSGGWSRIREIRRVIRRHSTSPWPSALWGYTSAQFHSLLVREKSPLKRLALRVAMLGCILLAGENAVSHVIRSRSRRPVDEPVPGVLPDGVLLTDFIGPRYGMQLDQLREQLSRQLASQEAADTTRQAA